MSAQKTNSETKSATRAADTSADDGDDDDERRRSNADADGAQDRVHEYAKRVAHQWRAFDNSKAVVPLGVLQMCVQRYGDDVDALESELANGALRKHKSKYVDKDADAHCKRLRDSTVTSVEGAYPHHTWETDARLMWFCNALHFALYATLFLCALSCTWCCREHVVNWRFATAGRALLVDVNMWRVLATVFGLLAAAHWWNLSFRRNHFLRAVYRDGYLRGDNPGFGKRMYLKTWTMAALACTALDVDSVFGVASVFVPLTIFVYTFCVAAPARTRRVRKYLYDNTAALHHVILADELALPYPRVRTDGVIARTCDDKHVYTPGALTFCDDYLSAAFARQLAVGMRMSGISPAVFFNACADEMTEEMRDVAPIQFCTAFVARTKDVLCNAFEFKLAAVLTYLWYFACVCVIVVERLYALDYGDGGDSKDVIIRIMFAVGGHLYAFFIPLAPLLGRVMLDTSRLPQVRSHLLNAVVLPELVTDACLLYAVFAFQATEPIL